MLVRAKLKINFRWQLLPVIVAAVYAVTATVLAVFIAIQRPDWAYATFRLLCPPATELTAQILGLFSDQIDSWLYTSLTDENLVERKVLYDMMYTLPTILFGASFYWLITWLAVKMISKWQRRKSG
jgi:hypothetical protein